MSKWHEVFERYESARLFLRKAYEGEWKLWFSDSSNDSCNEVDYDKYVKWKYKAVLYETALINYNILVDLSWALTYVSAEYLLYKYKKDNNSVANVEEVQKMHTVDEAIKMLRQEEKLTVSPTSNNNPFDYLKKMSPQFEPALERIVQFWNSFKNSSIREIYNFIKHRGTPIYLELDMGYERIMSLHIGKDEYPSDIRDVQMEISIEEGIDGLIDFDNDMLFSYIEGLISDLKKAVNPSPIIM